MASSLNLHHHYSKIIITFPIIFLLLLHLSFQVSTSIQLHPAISPRELLFEEKNRLGSLPPSCHNKCNECHPCMAVQVPTWPTHDSVVPPKPIAYTETWSSPSLQSNRYSNYKPLGWKCRCGNHFFNP